MNNGRGNMTVLVEKETEDELGFDYEEILRRVDE